MRRPAAPTTRAPGRRRSPPRREPPRSGRRRAGEAWRASTRPRRASAGSFGRALEALAADGVVHAKPQQPRDGLRADHVGRLEPGVAGREADRAGRGEQSRGGDELRVELAHRHEPLGIGRRRVRLAEREDRLVQLLSRQRIVGPEGRDVGSHHAREDDGRDLRRGPALAGRRARCEILVGYRMRRRWPAAPASRGRRGRAEGSADASSLVVSDAARPRLIGLPEMRTKSEQPGMRWATALEQARGAGDDPRLGEGARARRADGAVDDALLLRRARRAARRGRAQRRGASRRAPARRGRRPPPHARPVRPCGDGARRRPRLAGAPRRASDAVSNVSATMSPGSAAPASRSGCSWLTPTSRGGSTRHRCSPRRWRRSSGAQPASRSMSFSGPRATPRASAGCATSPQRMPAMTLNTPGARVAANTARGWRSNARFAAHDEAA